MGTLRRLPNAGANKAGPRPGARGVGIRLHRHRAVRREATADHANRLAPSTMRTCACPEPLVINRAYLPVRRWRPVTAQPICHSVGPYGGTTKLPVGGVSRRTAFAVLPQGPADIGANAEATSAARYEPILKSHFDCGFPHAALLISTG
jgi:hypothetical protein